MNNYKNNLCENIKYRRKQLGLTLKDIGDAVGVSQSTVKRWESGEIKSLMADKLPSLAKILQTTPNELLIWDEKSNTIDTANDKLFKKRNFLFNTISEANEENIDKIIGIVKILVGVNYE